MSRDDGSMIRVYNADQTTNKSMIEGRHHKAFFGRN
jgi:hypothetical protein